MGSRRLLAAFLMAGALAIAQSPAPPDEKLASVEGLVTQSISGAPLARVQVHLVESAKDDGPVYAASTRADGKFSIGNIPKGTYTVTAKRTGYVMSAARDGRRAFDLVLQPGNKKDDLAVKLTPTGSISGRVTGVDKAPMEGSAVTADDGTGEGPQSTTDANGNFRIGGLAPGKYRVRAGQEFVPFQPEIRTDGTEEIHYSPTYFPNALEPAAATRVEVRPDGEASGIAIQMVRTPLVFVRGVVLGAPRNALIQLMLGSGGRSRVAGVSQDGAFEIPNVDPGKYRLFASANLGGQRLRTTIAGVEVADKNIDRVELRMMPPISIAGQFEYDDDRPKTKTPRPALRLIDLIAATPADLPTFHDDGSFTVTDLLPSLYRVTLSRRGVFHPVVALRDGDQRRQPARSSQRRDRRRLERAGQFGGGRNIGSGERRQRPRGQCAGGAVARRSQCRTSRRDASRRRTPAATIASATSRRASIAWLPWTMETRQRRRACSKTIRRCSPRSKSTTTTS